MTETPFGNPDGTTPPDIEQPSIVDTMLNLDDFLSGDVRRAEKTFRFCTRPDLEAKIEDLNAELANLVDAQGRPRAVIDQAVGDGARSAIVVSMEIEALQDEYAASIAKGRVLAMDEDDWTAFQTRQKSAMSNPPPFPPAFYEDLIMSSDPRVAMPGGSEEKISVEQLRKLRKVLGHAAYDAIFQAAWAANTTSGVDVPKSFLSSAVQRQQTQG